ncbi:MAG: hypothetical protein ACR2QQ_05035 [Gammaproteobacteria bacterium]
MATFTSLYLVAALTVSLSRGNFEFLIYIVVMLILIGVVWLLHRNVSLSSGVLWGLSIWGAAHMAGGLVAVPEAWPINGDISVLYSWWLIPNLLKFDHIVHAYGFGIATWACWQGLAAAIRRLGGNVNPTGGLLILSAAAGMGLGAMNEVVEFAATLLVPETNVGGYINTGWDLVSNLVGVVIAAVLIRVFSKGATKA